MKNTFDQLMRARPINKMTALQMKYGPAAEREALHETQTEALIRVARDYQNQKHLSDEEVVATLLAAGLKPTPNPVSNIIALHQHLVALRETRREENRQIRLAKREKTRAKEREKLERRAAIQRERDKARALRIIEFHKNNAAVNARDMAAAEHETYMQTFMCRAPTWPRKPRGVVMVEAARRWWCPRHHIEFTLACECCVKEGGATPEYVALGRHVFDIDWGDERSRQRFAAQGEET